MIAAAYGAIDVYSRHVYMLLPPLRRFDVD